MIGWMRGDVPLAIGGRGGGGDGMRGGDTPRREKEMGDTPEEQRSITQINNTNTYSIMKRTHTHTHTHTHMTHTFDTHTLRSIHTHTHTLRYTHTHTHTHTVPQICGHTHKHEPAFR